MLTIIDTTPAVEHREQQAGRCSRRTYAHGVKFSADELADSTEVAEILGLSTPRSVSTYRARHEDFPVPGVEKGHGRCVLWLRADIEAWAKRRP